MRRTILIAVMGLCSLACSINAERIAKIASVKGVVQVQRKSDAEWRNARPGMPLDAGDQVYSHEESFAEISYAIGTVRRMDEKSKESI